MKIKSIQEPKTIKIDEPTWKKLKQLQLIMNRQTIDDTIWALLCQWEKQNYDLK